MGDCRDLRNRLASNGRDLLLSWALKGVPETWRSWTSYTGVASSGGVFGFSEFNFRLL